jgi:hypothetical protein
VRKLIDLCTRRGCGELATMSCGGDSSKQKVGRQGERVDKWLKGFFKRCVTQGAHGRSGRWVSTRCTGRCRGTSPMTHEHGMRGCLGRQLEDRAGPGSGLSSSVCPKEEARCAQRRPLA